MDAINFLDKLAAKACTESPDCKDLSLLIMNRIAALEETRSSNRTLKLLAAVSGVAAAIAILFSLYTYNSVIDLGDVIDNYSLYNFL